MTITYGIILLFFSVSVESLRLKEPKEDVPSAKDTEGVQKKCPEKAHKKMWGAWVDGRDAPKGKNVYGADYHASVMPAINRAMVPLQKNQTLDMDVWLHQLSALPHWGHKNKMLWRNYTNPIHHAVRACHRALPETQVQAIMSTVSVIDKNYAPSGKLTDKPARKLIHSLFGQFNKEVSSNPGRSQEILALAKLLQNLAYLHPMARHNGRSRLALLTYALRQRGLSCGTMMYNNNKNIYFEEVSVIAAKIEEGMEYYEKAEATSFEENPWQKDKDTAVKAHMLRFPKPEWNEALEQCWSRKIAKTGDHAKGTSPSLKGKNSNKPI